MFKREYMKHRITIIELIEIDIVNSRLLKGLNSLKLVKELEGLKLDSSIYCKDMCRLIFKLMGVKKRYRTDDLYEKYFELIGEEVCIRDKDKLRELSIKIFDWILKQKDFQ